MSITIHGHKKLCWKKNAQVCVCAYVNMFNFKYVAKRVKCIKKKIYGSMKSSTKLNLRLKTSATFAFVSEKTKSWICLVSSIRVI